MNEPITKREAEFFWLQCIGLHDNGSGWGLTANNRMFRELMGLRTSHVQWDRPAEQLVFVDFLRQVADQLDPKEKTS